ncbi:MAG TPA: tRNA uracil 4-sulfurtransferase ThiI [Anaerolineae bacterium]|nr:tRNA uracil 4-sulfurtransferase ThiI [Anaerolineae bacterium]
MVTRYAVIHYAEIALKGKNRPFFEKQLQRNVGQQLGGLDVGRVQRLHGRFLVHLGETADVEAVRERLRTVPGIAYFALAYATAKDLDALQTAVVQQLAGRTYRSFKIATRRADKQFPLTSEQINAAIGAHVQAATGWAVDLTKPELVVNVEVLPKEALFYFYRTDGVGGLPVGVSGKVGLLLSGGIDSPVAGYYALKRGCSVVPIHFHSGPFGQWLASEEKIGRLVAALGPYGLSSRHYVVPIGEIQQEIVVETPAPLRIILYRRLMIRIAQELTHREGGLALVTGENLGQVSSQTLESLRVIQAVAALPVLRPLIGLDKLEIINQAKAIGTYETSIEASDDCCQFLLPRQVVTRPAMAEVEAAEALLDIEGLVARGLASARAETVDPK